MTSLPVDDPGEASTGVLDDTLAVVSSHANDWVNLAPARKAEILEEVSRAFPAVADEWVRLSLEAKGFDAQSIAAGEEWLLLASIARALRLLRQSLLEISREGRPRVPGPVHQSTNGQLVARVVPGNVWDRAVFWGMTGDVWMEPGVSEAEMHQAQAWAYRSEQNTGKVALVLGAGNASMLPVIDSLHKLFVDNQVVILKMNPVNAYLAPLIERAFDGLIRRGFFRVIQGGIDEGAYLIQHDSVDEIHLTGSDRTFDAITFGTGEEGQRRKQMADPIMTRRFTAELGNISPVIIVPGPWTDREIDDQAEQIVTWLVTNAGFACLAPRLLIQHRDWPLRDRMNRAIGAMLSRIPTRNAYYPGAHDIHAAFVAAHPDAQQFGEPADGHLPWTFITDLESDATNDICFTREPFCGIVSETSLEAADPVEFIDRAVAFANSTLWGSLCATILVHPESMRDSRIASAVERAIADLQYGTVTVNLTPFTGYFFLTTPWGAFPGHSIADIQSGMGKTTNLLMLDRVQKSVTRGPFTKRFNPVRATSRRTTMFAKTLAQFEAERSPRHVPRLLRSSLLVLGHADPAVSHVPIEAPGRAHQPWWKIPHLRSG